MAVGRKPGVHSIMTALAKAEAQLSGLLPHQWLLAVMQGKPIKQMKLTDVKDRRGKVIGQEYVEVEVYPELSMRHDAAKAAAPFYAPKLATQVITLRGRSELLGDLTDEQLGEAIGNLEASIKEADAKKSKSRAKTKP